MSSMGVIMRPNWTPGALSTTARLWLMVHLFLRHYTPLPVLEPCPLARCQPRPDVFILCLAVGTDHNHDLDFAGLAARPRRSFQAFLFAFEKRLELFGRIELNRLERPLQSALAVHVEKHPVLRLTVGRQQRLA